MRQSLIAATLIFGLLAPFLFQDVIATTPVLTQSNHILAQQGQNDKVGNDKTAEKEDDQKINYALPYPGILPDHLLYPLKVLRDRILELLIRDPLRKLDFYLLMADKRLNMGIFLQEKDKPELAETTVSKGEKYFLKGVDQLEKVSQSDEIVLPKDTVTKYKTASLKHQEVLEELRKNAPENLQSGYNLSLNIVQEIQEKIAKLGK